MKTATTYYQKHYQANRDKILERQMRNNAKRKGAISEYAKKWHQENKDKINQRRKAQYHANKQLREQGKLDSTVIGPTEAAKMLGLSLRQFRQWVTDKKVPSSKSPTGRRLLLRSDIDEMISKRERNINSSVQVVRTQEGFIVPSGFDLITEYNDLTEYTLAFAAGKLSFLLMIGSPGSGKSRQIRSDLERKNCTWIDNHVSNLGLYCKVFESNNAPVVLDDVNHFMANKQSCSLVKAFTQTERVKNISWESTVSILDERGIPRNYETSSPFCFIGNAWNSSNADFAAIQDRAMPVAFFPSAETIHKRVIELGWCTENDVVKFIGDNLETIPQPSMREYYLGSSFKRAGFDWKKKLRSLWAVI